MPELPEVETILRGLSPRLSGQKLAQLETRRAGLRHPFPENLTERTANSTITRLSRRAKYLLIHLETSETLILHLGMSGRLTLIESHDSRPPAKHDHVIFTLGNHTRIFFNDPRRFGSLDLTANLASHPALASLGIEPLSPDFSGDSLAHSLQSCTSPIKLAIMEQKRLVGVGNIYASESLYRAHILPTRPANSLSRDECHALANAIQQILADAIAAGGSSLRDYVQSDGELGYFQHHFAVYDKKNCPCPSPNCAGHITKITQSGRATYFCPICQT